MATCAGEHIERAWLALAFLLFVPRTETDYQRLVTLLDSLIDRVGEVESHPLASLVEVVEALIERYEDELVSGLDEPSPECG